MGSLSIVTTIYTESRLGDFSDLVFSVSKQTVKPEMIVVVERGRKLKEQVDLILSSHHIPSRVIFSELQLGLAGARNAGALAASSDYVGFVDDDAMLDPFWSQKVIENLDGSPEVIGVTGLTVPQWIDPEDSWFPRPLYWLIGCSDTRVANRKSFVFWASGTNMAFRRSLFHRILFDVNRGGIKPGKTFNYAGDENEFVLRALKETGKKILFDPSLMVYHKVSHYKVSHGYIRKYALMQGYAEAEYRRKFPYCPRNALSVFLLGALIRESLEAKSGYVYKRLSAMVQVLIFAIIGYAMYSLSSPSSSSKSPNSL